MVGKMSVFLLLFSLFFPAAALAESRQFLGTRTGWARTGEVFAEGRYNGKNLFLVIGTGPTTGVLKTISSWKSRTTYEEDIQSGIDTFTGQAGRAAESVPDNAEKFGKSCTEFFTDPYDELLDFSIITPAAIVYKTAVNAALIGWYGVMTVGEPVARLGAGTLAAVGSPFIKPVTYTGVGLLYAGTALYGYGSSAAGGAILAGATGAVVLLDAATAPVIAMVDTSEEAPVSGEGPAAQEADGAEDGLGEDGDPVLENPSAGPNRS